MCVIHIVLTGFFATFMAMQAVCIQKAIFASWDATSKARSKVVSLEVEVPDCLDTDVEGKPATARINDEKVMKTSKV